LHSKDIAGKLIRSKGYFGLATRPQMAGSWSQAGGIARYGFGGYFWKAIGKEQWPDDPEYLASIEAQWEEPFGDMRQEMVFIGQGIDKQEVTRKLDDCLLTEQELLAGMPAWARLPDPFPAWD
jgi:G3E family GTPase